MDRGAESKLIPSSLSVNGIAKGILVSHTEAFEGYAIDVPLQDTEKSASVR